MLLATRNVREPSKQALGQWISARAAIELIAKIGSYDSFAVVSLNKNKGDANFVAKQSFNFTLEY